MSFGKFGDQSKTRKILRLPNRRPFFLEITLISKGNLLLRGLKTFFLEITASVAEAEYNQEDGGKFSWTTKKMGLNHSFIIFQGVNETKKG